MRDRIKAVIASYRRDMRVQATAALCINCAYAGFLAVCGAVLPSKWLGALAFYYIVLTFLRVNILRGHRQESLGRKWRICRSCGVVMLALTAALGCMYVLTIDGSYRIRYPGYMIYAVAAYTFYAAVRAIRNAILSRRADDPVISASRALDLAVAAISMYSLQSAMTAAFGDDERFRVTMGNCVGAGVFLIIVCISVVMITRANRAIRKI